MDFGINSQMRQRCVLRGAHPKEIPKTPTGRVYRRLALLRAETCSPDQRLRVCEECLIEAFFVRRMVSKVDDCGAVAKSVQKFRWEIDDAPRCVNNG